MHARIIAELTDWKLHLPAARSHWLRRAVRIFPVSDLLSLPPHAPETIILGCDRGIRIGMSCRLELDQARRATRYCQCISYNCRVYNCRVYKKKTKDANFDVSCRDICQLGLAQVAGRRGSYRVERRVIEDHHGEEAFSFTRAMRALWYIAGTWPPESTPKHVLKCSRTHKHDFET